MQMDLSMIALGLTAGLALLAVVLFILAAFHDRVVTAAGPTEELEIIKARIEDAKSERQHIEDDIEKRRNALADMAGAQADVDALVRQRDDLQAEWASLEQRRQEVLDVRQDLEAAMAENLSVEGELAGKREELSVVQDRLERAEQLVHRTEALKREQEELDQQIATLRGEQRRLAEAEARVAELTDKAAAMQTRLSEIEGLTTAREATLGELGARLVQDRLALSAVQSEAAQSTAELEAKAIELQRRSNELAGLAEQKSQMQARLEALSVETDKAKAQVAGGGGAMAAQADPLQEVNSPPPVIEALKALAPPSERITEPEALRNVQLRLRALGLEYPDRTLRAFHTAMKVNETTQMAVLAGISGTGKSQLPRQYAAAMGIGFLQVPVQPRWDSPQDLMGFYNYIEGKYRPTDMARALWALDTLNNPEAALPDRMMMVLLDEMNLARVEYYFSEFLSRLESRPAPADVQDKRVRKDAEIELEIPRLLAPPRIFPGYNLLFAGTMNEDESTQSLSEKVVDRANILRFGAPKQIRSGGRTGTVPAVSALSQQNWASWVRPPSRDESDAAVVEALDNMVALMKDFGRPFGHRLGRAILAYVANYPDSDGIDRTRTALADQVEMRLLPKLRGVEVEETDRAFSDLRRFVEQDLEDEALSQAIDASLRAAETTGQFAWSGVTRE